MSWSTREYARGTYITISMPFGTHVKARALCPDGKVRATKRIAETADTFFSVPAAIDAHGKTVAGYITVETVQGLSTETPDDPAIVKFVPYKYRKNHAVFAVEQAIAGKVAEITAKLRPDEES